MRPWHRCGVCAEPAVAPCLESTRLLIPASSSFIVQIPIVVVGNRRVGRDADATCAADAPIVAVLVAQHRFDVIGALKVLDAEKFDRTRLCWQNPLASVTKERPAFVHANQNRRVANKSTKRRFRRCNLEKQGREKKKN